jgi:homogentisate 1,2-dioxygenase
VEQVRVWSMSCVLRVPTADGLVFFKATAGSPLFVDEGRVMRGLSRLTPYVPRPLEQDPSAQRVPFFHRNTDYDEFIFYHDGDFFSKDNIYPGMATLHPRGIHHGPHPKALANQAAKTHTDEYAVMLDGFNPIQVLPPAETVELKDYWKSWMEK